MSLAKATDWRVETIGDAARLATGLMMAYGNSPAMPHGVIQGGILGDYLRIGDYYVVPIGDGDWEVQTAPTPMAWRYEPEPIAKFADAGAAVLEAFAMAHEDWLEGRAAQLLERNGP